MWRDDGRNDDTNASPMVLAFSGLERRGTDGTSLGDNARFPWSIVPRQHKLDSLKRLSKRDFGSSLAPGRSGEMGSRIDAAGGSRGSSTRNKAGEPAIFSADEDSDRDRGTARRGQRGRVVPQRREQPESLLRVVQRAPETRQGAASRQAPLTSSGIAIAISQSARNSMELLRVSR